MAATVAHQFQATEVSSKKHAACDECRGRKLKCSGDFPLCVRCRKHDLVCHYSEQKPMGRPRKRRRSNPSEEQEVPDLPPDLMDGVSEPWPTDGDTMPMIGTYPNATPWPTLGDSPLGNFIEPGDQVISVRTPKPTPMPEIDFSNWEPPDFSIPSPFSTTPGLTYASPEHIPSPNPTTLEPSTPDSASCPCRQNLYSTLTSFQSLPPPFFPVSLAPLRTAASIARTAIQCSHCPANYPTALQNMMLLGTLFPLIVDHYRKLLLSIDTEAANGRPKMYRIGDASAENAHLHTGAPDCPMGVEIELTADDWRRMARKIIRRDVLGREDGSADPGGVVGLIQDIERRQQRQHQKHREENTRMPGSPCSEGDGHRHGEGDYLCLKIVGLAKVAIAGLDLGIGGRARESKLGDSSVEADVVVDEVVVSAPSKQQVKFSDNINRWPFTSINF